MSGYKQILYAKENRVATITLNRPEKLNAYSEVMVHEILAALADARDDEAIRAVILTGAGRGFCSGGDVSRDFQYPSRYRGHRLESMLEMRENMDQLITFLQRFDKPVIAAVNGPAVAGGLTLALACDFRIAAASAKLGDTSLRFALIPDEGGAYLFPGGKRDKPLSNMAMLALLDRMGRSDLTAHGFRSTFRDWAAECTSYPREVAEMALAHVVENKVEAAYRRGDLFEKRRAMMDEWQAYIRNAQ